MTQKRWNEEQKGGELVGRVEKIRGKLLKDESVRAQISRRAYELYLSRGGKHGHDFEDWVQAENEILTPLIERELKRSSEVQITRVQEGGAAATTRLPVETPAPKKVPVRDEGGATRFVSTKPAGAGTTTVHEAETPAPKKIPTRDEGAGGRLTSTKPAGATTAREVETPASRKIPTRDEGGGSSTKPAGAKRPRKKTSEEESPH